MAKLPYGITGPFIGRVGNIVGYMLNGINVIRELPKFQPPKTPKQLANQQRMSLISSLATAIEDFLRFSFRSVATHDKLGPRNYAISANKEYAVKGTYPEQKTDFEKLIVAAGNIPAPKNPQLKLNGNQLEFSWEADLETKGTNKRDQIMLLAYFPDSAKSVFLTSGAHRTAEREVLQLPAFAEHTIVETYMAFVADDRNDASNSVYMGQVILSEGLGAVEETPRFLEKLNEVVDPETGEITTRTEKVEMWDIRDVPDLTPVQSAKMAEISHFLSNFKEQIRVGYHSSDTRDTAFNKAISHNITAALFGNAYAYHIDFPKLVFSKGKRESAWATRLIPQANRMLKISWEVPETANMNIIGDDKVYIILYNSDKLEAISVTADFKRKDFSALIKLHNTRPGDLIHAWIFFASADGRISSNSNYLGNLMVLE